MPPFSLLTLLTVQCGGPEAAVDAARPLLEAMGKRIIHCEGAWPVAGLVVKVMAYQGW